MKVRTLVENSFKFIYLKCMIINMVIEFTSIKSEDMIYIECLHGTT